MSTNAAAPAFPETVLIVGATSGIGRGLAERLRRSGRTVIAGGRNRAALEQMAEAGYSVVEIDVRDPESVSRAG